MSSRHRKCRPRYGPFRAFQDNITKPTGSSPRYTARYHRLAFGVLAASRSERDTEATKRLWRPRTRSAQTASRLSLVTSRSCTRDDVVPQLSVWPGVDPCRESTPNPVGRSRARGVRQPDHVGEDAPVVGQPGRGRAVVDDQQARIVGWTDHSDPFGVVVAVAEGEAR